MPAMGERDGVRAHSVGEPVHHGDHVTIPIGVELNVQLKVADRTYDLGWISAADQLPGMLRETADLFERSMADG